MALLLFIMIFTGHLIAIFTQYLSIIWCKHSEKVISGAKLIKYKLKLVSSTTDKQRAYDMVLIVLQHKSDKETREILNISCKKETRASSGSFTILLSHLIPIAAVTIVGVIVIGITAYMSALNCIEKLENDFY
jgi:hypothetical protein